MIAAAVGWELIRLVIIFACLGLFLALCGVIQ